ncbi:hypothetical protein BGY98DRAFT_223739 [Russula aff. rugulosa BPL654]|nr:hypothetical protein BGY98DRAFT_223739 [Russula aff. rugulosa BPL654]
MSKSLISPNPKPEVAAPNCERPSCLLKATRRSGRLGILTCKGDFIGLGVLLSTAKAVRADQVALSEMFERIEAFFGRLEIYTEVAPNEGMVKTITAILVEVLNFIGIATKEMKQSRTKKYVKKLMGKNDIEHALKRLDRLTQEEARMASAQLCRSRMPSIAK